MNSVQETLTALGSNQESIPPLWQRSLSRAIRNPLELLEQLELPLTLLPSIQAGAEEFPLLVPQSFLRRMRVGDPLDPLLRQVLPIAEEAQIVEGFDHDPVGDLNSKQQPGMLQKYKGRVLLMATGSCAVHCRYCFRRHYPYDSEPKSLDQWQPSLHSIAADTSINEVILSGGDPLILSDVKLSKLVHQLELIPHLKRLRIHSRLPIVLPDRVTSGLIDLLKNTRMQTIMVVHANHGNELVDDCAQALQQLVTAGIPTLNQAVLLKGVNDSAQALIDLCERSINLGVMPYYLHHLDRVQGASHFEVPSSVGLQLLDEIREHLPGYAVPRYVREIPGNASKTLISSVISQPST